MKPLLKTSGVWGCFTNKSLWMSKRDACEDRTTVLTKQEMKRWSLQRRCLHRVADSRQDGFGYPNPMLAKTDRHRGKSGLGVQNQYLLRVADTQRAHLDRQKQCLLRVTDTHAKGFVITNPMLAKSERHKSKPSAVVMTKAVLAQSDGRSASINCL